MTTAWDPRTVVEGKRDGRRLQPEELRRFILGFAAGTVPDYLAAAFLMAAFIQGLDASETDALLDAMIDSGERLDLAGLTRPSVDKHSTGGVADDVTLVFAPLAASLGLAVAKLSGRGLGHTGGTLDKLESIPGFRTDLPADRFLRQVDEIGVAIAAQGPTMVPADGALYALRDATATVPAVPLIATSVMSKKLAVSTDLILLDVKAGSGAFMKDVESASSLARLCVGLAERRGRRIRAAVTDMSQPLGEAVGNAVAVRESIEILRGERAGRLRDLAVVFVVEALVQLTGASREGAQRAATAALEDGHALETFRRLVEAQGGDPAVADDPARVLPDAPVTMPIVVGRSGWVGSIDAEAIGRAAADLGAGRHRKGEEIDPAVGLSLAVDVGDAVAEGDGIGHVLARSEGAASSAAARVLDAVTVASEPVMRPDLVHAWFGT